MDMRRSQWECEVTWQAWTNFWFPATVNCHQAASMFYTTRRSGIPKKEFGTSWCVSSIVYGGLGQSWHVRMEATLIRGLLMAEPALTRPHTLTEKQAKLQRSGDGWPRPAKCLTQWPMSPRAQPCQSKKLGEVTSRRSCRREWETSFRKSLLRVSFLSEQTLTPPPPWQLIARWNCCRAWRLSRRAY